MTPVYILLITSSLVLCFVPLSLFNNFGYWTKALIVTGLLNLPIFFAAIIFIESFRRTPHKDVAFGSNLLGAAVGGILESLSFIFGINALLLLVVLFYILSFLFVRNTRNAGPDGTGLSGRSSRRR